MKKIKAESLAYWYLRLNGFLTTVNFVIHPEYGHNQRTDADILAVRFPFRAERLTEPMADDYNLIPINRSKALMFIAEVKKGLCRLNGPWTNPKKHNMERVLRAIGAFPQNQNDFVASELYDNGWYENDQYVISLICLGKRVNDNLKQKYPKVKQITWPVVFSFIYERFKAYPQQKSSHPQWDNNGKILWNVCKQSSSVDEYINFFKIIS